MAPDTGAIAKTGPWSDEDLEHDFYESHPDCRCDGSGFYVTCIDDVCRGSGYCIHGDGMAVCPCEGWEPADA